MSAPDQPEQPEQPVTPGEGGLPPRFDWAAAIAIAKLLQSAPAEQAQA